MDWWLLVSYVGVFAVGTFIGYQINEWVLKFILRSMVEESGTDGKDLEKFIKYWDPILNDEGESEKPKMSVYIKKINDQIMCYEKDTGRFLAQAETRDELIDALTARLGPVTLHIEPEDGADYIKDPA